MKDLVITTALLAWSAVIVICITWRDIRHRQCECAEAVAALENPNPKPTATIGFSNGKV